MSQEEQPTRCHLILGGTGGIGSSLARRLRSGGDRVALAARGEERLAALGQELDAPWFALDATRPEEVEAAARAAAEASRAMHPLGRLGEPGEVAAVMAWLLGPESGWVTGQVIGIDGGLAALRVRAG